MSQSRKHSWIEAIINTLVGMLISFGIQVALFSWMNIPVTFGENIFITIIFTVVSILRGYVIRRIFNAKKDEHKGNS